MRSLVLVVLVNCIVGLGTTSLAQNNGPKWRWAQVHGSIYSQEQQIISATDTKGCLITLENYLDSAEAIERTYNVKFSKYDVSGKLLWRHKISQTNSKNSNLGFISLSVDSNDNIYCVFNYVGNLYIDSQLWGQSEILGNESFCKFSSEGKIIWNNIISSYGPLSLHIMISRQNTIYVYGNLIAGQALRINYITYIDTCHSRRFFLGKFDSTGKVLWIQKKDTESQIERPGYGSQALAASFDHNDNLFVCGTFNDTIIIDGFTTIPERFDVFIAKFTPQGSLVWIKSISGKDNDNACDITIDKQDNCYVLATITDSVIITNTQKQLQYHISGEGGAYLIVQFDSSGTVKWHKRISDRYIDQSLFANLLCNDQNGNNGVLVGFNTTENTIFDTLPLDYQYTNYLASLTSAGILQWITPIVQDPRCHVYSIISGLPGDYYISGECGEVRTALFDSSFFSVQLGNEVFTTNGGFDCFIGKLSGSPSAVKDLHYSSLTTTAYPNPFTDRTTISLPAATTEPVIAQLYNSLGVKVLEQHYPAGASSVSLSRAGLPAGVYHYNIQGLNSIYASGQVIIL